MFWLIAIAAVVLAFLWDSRRRAHRFVRSVIFLDALDCGETIEVANSIANTFGDDPDMDRRSIERADRIRVSQFDGKQLPIIAVAVERGFKK